MQSDISSPADAVAHLLQAGLNAELHNGPVGGGLRAWSRVESGASGITILHDLTYITFIHGQWHVFNASTAQPEPQPSLKAATAKVAQVILSK
jgi:hypothetical protein